MRRLLIILLVLALGGGFLAYNMYNKPHADMADVTPDVVLSTAELFKAFESDEDEANEKYLGKIIQISGVINSINSSEGEVVSLGLETGDMLAGLTCLLDEVDKKHRQDFKEGERVTLNCICTGKLMDIELNRCVELKK